MVVTGVSGQGPAGRPRRGPHPALEHPVGACPAGLFLKQALEEVGGRVEDTEAFRRALRAVAITPRRRRTRGPIPPASLAEPGSFPPKACR
jgi:hypothetical protein